MKRFTTADINPKLLSERTIAIIGYGSQGSAQAQNLRDSGANVIIGVRDPNSASAQAAERDGFTIMPPVFAADEADIIMLLTPDETHAAVYEELADNLDLSGKAIGFAHGYAVHYGLITPSPKTDLILIAPKGVGPAVRERYLAGSGVAALVATANDASGQALDLALAYAQGIGSDRVAIFETSFQEETEADLFSEQGIIVGGLTELLRAGYETLTGAGYAPEVAYFECVFEAKLILDLIVERGFTGMFERISNTAEYGAQEAGTRVISPQVRAELDALLKEIQDGSFAKRWNKEVRDGYPNLTDRRAQWQAGSLEATATALRKLLQ